MAILKCHQITLWWEIGWDICFHNVTTVGYVVSQCYVVMFCRLCARGCKSKNKVDNK